MKAPSPNHGTARNSPEVVFILRAPRESVLGLSPTSGILLTVFGTPWLVERKKDSTKPCPTLAIP